MKRKKKKVIIGIVGSLVVTGGVFMLGSKFGEEHFIHTLIKLYENGDNRMIVSDKKTGLIYEMMAECIGD